MLILVTNDDGVNSPTTLKLAHTLRDLGYDVIVAAPSKDWSGSGKALGSMNDVKIYKRRVDGIDVYSLDAPPAAIVAIFVDVLGFNVDVVVSGINYGPNLGIHDILTSGTIGAALEAAFRGVLGISLSSYCSRSDYDCVNYAVKTSKPIVEFIINVRDRPFNAVSVNIPKPPPQGVRWVKPSPIIPRLKGDVELAGDYITVRLRAKVHSEIYRGESDNYDGGALLSGYITLTPISLSGEGLRIPVEKVQESIDLGELRFSVI